MTTLLLYTAAVFAQADLDRTAQRIVQQTNEYREQKDLKPVQENRQLKKAAHYFAEYLAEEEKLDHEADGSTPAKRAEEYGYEYCIVLENIASERRDADFTSRELAASLVEGWQESKPHRENLLDGDVTETGVAVARNAKSGRYYAVQMFGRPRSAQLEFTMTNESKEEVTYELDGREQKLPARVSRKYSVCQLPKLIIHLDEKRQETFTPQAGETVAIVKQDGTIRVERRPKEK